MTDPVRLLPSTLTFSRRIQRRYIAPAAERGQPAPDGEPLVPMGFVQRPIVQVSALRPTGVAARILERTVQPALPLPLSAAGPAAQSTENVVAPTSETVSWPELSARTTVEPVAPFVPAAPEPSPERAAPAGEAPVRRGFTLDEVRRALQRPARTRPSLPPVQREERQPAQSDEGGMRGTQDVQGETAAARPRPMSRLVEQPQQPVSHEQSYLETTTPSATLSAASEHEPSAQTAPPGSTAGAEARQAAPVPGAAGTTQEQQLQGTPTVPTGALRTEAVNREPESREADAPPGAVAPTRLAAAEPSPLTDESASLREPFEAPDEPGAALPAEPVESTAIGAVPPADSIQRAPATSPPPAVIRPFTSTDGVPTREAALTDVPPPVGPETSVQRRQLTGADAQQPSAVSSVEPSEVSPDASGAYPEPYESDSERPESPHEALPGSPEVQASQPQGAPSEIRRTPTPSGSRADVHRAALPSPTPGTPTAPDVPDAGLDLPSAYRAQLARYAAETQSPVETSGPDLGPEPAALPDDNTALRPPVRPLATSDGPGREAAPAVPTPNGARAASLSPIARAVRREPGMVGQEPPTDGDLQSVPATYDSARPLQRRSIRLDQALGVSSSPAPPAVQPSPPVRRSVTQGDTSRAEPATEAAPAAASPAQAPAEGAPDLEELAERVFVKLRTRLRVERERLGGTRFR